MLAYWVALVTLASISATNGNARVWYSSVKDAQFVPGAKTDLAATESKPAVAGGATVGVAGQPVYQQGYPPQQAGVTQV